MITFNEPCAPLGMGVAKAPFVDFRVKDIFNFTQCIRLFGSLSYYDGCHRSWAEKTTERSKMAL